jgi:carbamoyl-phosphate synthase small subunit
VAERVFRRPSTARRGFGDAVAVEAPCASAQRRTGPHPARRQQTAWARSDVRRRRAPVTAGPIVAARRIEYARASMDSSLIPALLAGPRSARLTLADETVFTGYAAGADALASGEVVFNTSMFGYQEMFTDPSYRGQILVLTAAHVGNVGINEDDQESGRVWAAGLIVPDLALIPSNWRARGGVLEALESQQVPVAWGFDTRALVLHLRERGALPGVLACGRQPSSGELAGLLRAAHGTDGCDLTGDVARPEIEAWSAGPWRSPSASPLNGASPSGPPTQGPGPRVVVIDCGAKRSILRRLVAVGADVVVMPPSTPAADVLAQHPAGVVVSNGPGDPGAVAAVPETLRALLGKAPVLGICLGHQLLARALGGRTFKLRFGHHGANHPVRDDATGAVWITSQNHNYAVDPASLPADVRVSMTNLTDGSVEGLLADDLGAEGIQFHPEAGPGPHDALGVFARFLWRCRRSA